MFNRLAPRCLLTLTCTLPVGCGVIPIPADLDSGITGIVLAGPQCPVVGPDSGEECDDQPYQATVIVRSQLGIEVARFTADEAGEFRVPLYPGNYTLDPLPGENGLPSAQELTVTVEEGAFAEIMILYDTGIR